MRTIIIGGGNMGSAFARALLLRGVCKPVDLTVVESRLEQRVSEALNFIGCGVCSVQERESNVRPAEFNERVTVIEKLPSTLDSFDVVLIAVKPQEFSVVAQELRALLTLRHIVVSIMAGVDLAALREALGSELTLVRAMPNLPAQIGEGMTVYVVGTTPAQGALSESHARAMQQLLSAPGLAFQVSAERLLDSATALSGNGPAYVFYFIECFERIAVEMGFSDEQARILVEQTARGALLLWGQGTESASMLRARVTSKGGTTEAAFNEIVARGVGEALAAGALAGSLRSRQLSEVALKRIRSEI